MNRLEIKYRVSKQLCLLFLMLHMAAVMAIWLLHFVWWLKLILFLSILVSLYVNYQWLFHPVIIGCYCVDGDWFVIRRSNDDESVELLSNSFVSKCLVILNFRVSFCRRRCTLLLSSDSLSSKTLKKLRVFVGFIV